LLLGLEEHPRDIAARFRSVGGEQLYDRVKVEFGPLLFTKPSLAEIVSYIESECIDLVLVDTLHAWWGEDNWSTGKPFPAGARFSSDNNGRWLSAKELKELIG
jgi:hypothetical protein